ncbi:NAD(P)-dependent oxidoreductase [Candidatus Pelagibacter sp.]|jgi:nucleoside-diphosphate-sugar epimerase|nr:NAD(P)-dependent oxidoreductase [Candidatus Pelagibacter sp.]
MKICIFGGNGFIGSNLANYYHKKKHKVYVYTQTKVNKNSKIKNNFKIKYSEKNFTYILNKKFDLVYFLSGNSNQETSKSDIYYDLTSTFNTFVNLLEAVKKNKSKPPIWFASSVVVYGSNNKPLKENFERNPISYYALTKYLCENAGKFYNDNFNLNIGIMRIFSTFGPGLKKLVVYDTIKKINSTKNFKVFGTGNEIRDLAFVDDQIKTITTLCNKIKKPQGDIFNIAAGKPYTIKNIVKKLVKISRKKVLFSFTKKRRSFDTKNFIADKSKTNKIIGFVKKTPIDVALKKTYDSI